MKTSWLAIFLPILAGCATDLADQQFYQDVVRTIEIAQAYGDPKTAACAGFIRGQIDWTKKVLDEPTAGLISRAYRDYLAAIEASGKEAEVEEACSPVIGAVAIKALRNMR